MDANTSGFKGWKEVNFFEGKKDGRMTGRQGYRNVTNGQEFIPEKGWDADPPYPTGELACSRHITGGTDELWESFRQKAIADAEAAGAAPPLWTKGARHEAARDNPENTNLCLGRESHGADEAA
jgi:hypothetical protein